MAPLYGWLTPPTLKVEATPLASATPMPEAYWTSTETAFTEANPPKLTAKAALPDPGLARSSNTVLPASIWSPNEAPEICA